jgi:predicted ester cyclase
MGIAATGREVEVAGIEVNRIDGGKIAESWALSDASGLRDQLEAAGDG